MCKTLLLPALIRYVGNADGSKRRVVREFGMDKAYYTKRAFSLNNRGYLDYFAVENVKVKVTENSGFLNTMELV